MSGFRKKARTFFKDTFSRSSRPVSRTHSPSPAPPPTPPDPPPTPPTLAYANPPQQSSALGTTGSIIHELLATARDGADLCLPLKAALVGVVKIWDICERTGQVKDEYQRANGKLAHLHKIAIAYGKEKGLDEKFQKRLDEISGALNQLTAFAQEKENRGLVIRVLESNEDVATVKGLLEHVSSLLEVFQFESIVTIELCLKEVLQQLAVADGQRVAAEEERIAAEATRLATEEKRLATEAARLAAEETRLVTEAARLVTEEKRLAKELAKELAEEQEKIMKTIKTVLGDNFVSGAAHDEQPTHAGCMPGTREGILNKLVTWVLTEPTAIFWLAGMAGTGKTSIAITLSRMLEKEPAVMMGGGFFCSRSAGSIARTDVRRIIPTLAGLLAGKSLEFARALAVEVEEDPRVGHKPVAEQIGTLLRKPLASLPAMTLPLVFVIDALDECDDQTELAQLIKDIAEFEVTDAKVKVKFILTSRPEMHIRGTPIADTRFSSILQLHTISETEVTSDIRLYIERTLEGCSPDATWYTTHDVDALLKLASGLFIFASTVLKFILARENVSNRMERLRKATATVGVGTAATATLDKIYEMVIAEASQPDLYDTDELQEVKRVLACILTARTSLSVRALAELLAMQPTNLRGSLERLHSVVYLPTEDADPALRTLHASFGDFLFDTDRAPKNMHIDAALGHTELAQGCLARMKKSDLCFNVSHSKSSHERISQPSQVDWIPLSLVYACIHWAHHVHAASDRPAVEVNIAKCFRPKFLFWLEAMVVLGKVDRSSLLLRISAQAVQGIEIKQFLRDATSFVDTSYPAIAATPPHIYHSALSFAPKESLVYQDFYPLCTNLISVETKGIDRHGGNLAMALTGLEGRVNSIAYSPDGLLLTSSSDDGTVRLWDTRTGLEAISPLRSGDGKVTSVAFSPDGRFVASGTSDGLIHIWDVKTGRLSMIPLLGHDGSVACVAFSPDGRLIASAGSDRLVRLWDAETGEILAAMEGHKRSVTTVVFNLKGNILASCCDYGDVWRWDVLTRKQMSKSYSHDRFTATSIAFSPDGSAVAVEFRIIQEVRVWDAEFEREIVSVIAIEVAPNGIAFSSDSQYLFTVGANGITSWNWRSGQKLSTMLSNSVNSISCSTDGLYIASVSDDRNIYIWNAKVSHGSSQTLHAHNGGVNAVALSVDGCTIASASEDGTVGLWNTRSGEALVAPLLGHGGAVNSVVISPDGRLAVSSSADCTIRIWDIETGAPVGEPLGGHEGSVNALAFSPDGAWLASASSDQSVRFWQTSTEGPPTEALEPLPADYELHSLAYSPDGTLIAAGASWGDIWVWSTTHGKDQTRKLIGPDDPIRSVIFTSDGNFILSVVRSRIQAWNARIHDSKVAWELKEHSGVSTVQVSPSGQHIVSGANDGSICIWDMVTKALLHKLHGHTAVIRSVVVTADNLRLVSCSDDGTIRIWNLAEVTSPESQYGGNPLPNLSLARRNDGWLVGPSDELLLWVPKDYVSNLAIDGTTLIAKHTVTLTVPEGGICDGTNWTACWRA